MVCGCIVCAVGCMVCGCMVCGCIVCAVGFMVCVICCIGCFISLDLAKEGFLVYTSNADNVYVLINNTIAIINDNDGLFDARYAIKNMYIILNNG